MGPNGINEKTLTATGIAEIERTAQTLKRMNIVPDAIVTSPLKHAHHSAEIVDGILFANKRGQIGKPKKKKKTADTASEEEPTKKSKKKKKATESEEEVVSTKNKKR